MKKINLIKQTIVRLLKCKFSLYTKRLKTMQNVEAFPTEKGWDYVYIDPPIPVFVDAIYCHTFGCSLTEALFDYKCLFQILKFKRFAHGCTNDLSSATKFSIYVFPIWYIYSIIDTKMFHKIKVWF